MSFLNDTELNELGFASLGKNVKVSRRASIYNANRISVGDCSRIDDFCVLSPGTGGIQRFPLCPEPTEIRGVWQNGFANFAPMYGGGKLPMN